VCDKSVLCDKHFSGKSVQLTCRCKNSFREGELPEAVEQAAAWAEKFVSEFAAFQEANLPWLKK
jgi:hypothetical protein